MPDSPQTVYLFQCRGEDLYAVSRDASGANIPRSPCTQGWEFCQAFRLGRRLSLPVPVMAESVLKGIADYGYYVWRGWSGSDAKRPLR